MKRLPAILGLLAILAGAFAYQPTFAATKTKAPKQDAKKERLVLMPLRVSEEDRELQGEMEAALVEGLAIRYEVYSGEQVQQKARQMFNKESARAKHDCDETRCMQDIAEAFQAELIAVVDVKKRNDGYFLALTMQNIFDNKVVYSKSTPCKGCDAYQIMDKLKQLAGGSADNAALTTESATGTPSEPAPEASAPKAADAETDLWEQVQKGNTAEDYNAYLGQYPKGKYAVLAKTRLSRLKQEAQAESDKQEKQAWEDAQQTNTQDSYQGYLEAYARGKYAVLATGRIAKLKKVQADEEAKQKREQLAEEAKQKREAALMATSSSARAFSTGACRACHAIDRDVVGPAWRRVAEKYGSASALAKVFKDGFKVEDRKIANSEPKYKSQASIMTGQYNVLIRGHEDDAASALFDAVRAGGW